MQGFAQYHIKGDVTGVEDGAMLYLTLVDRNQQRIDSVRIKGGHFEFQSEKHVDEPRWALVNIEKNFVALCDFYLENGNILITGERYNTRAHGTPTNEAYNEYNDSINSLFTDLGRLHTSAMLATNQTSRDSALNAEHALEQVQVTREEAFIQKYPASPISQRVIDYRARRADSKQIIRMLNMLAPEVQSDSLPYYLRDFARRLAKTEGGATAPDFTLYTSDGKPITLSSMKGKYVLLDFWASWCAPCRASFPTIAKLYQEYHSDNFEIIGISVDRSEAAWRKALEQEKAPWIQVLDKDGSVGKLYALMAIPHLVIISPQGTIAGAYDKAEINEELTSLLNKQK